jgi:hypothetical protein
MAAWGTLLCFDEASEDLSIFSSAGRVLPFLQYGLVQSAQLAAPRECAVFLLHVGAEVEQALMVQYLYAAYSLGGPQIADPVNREKALRWRQTIADIAQQEMGHLVTVENLLQLIGGPLTLERQDFPAPSELYPFKFTLQPLTLRSLAQYVLAEMPDEKTICKLKLTDKIEEVKKAAGGDMGATKVNRVGVLYSAIAKLFTLPGPNTQPVGVSSVPAGIQPAVGLRARDTRRAIHQLAMPLR